MVDEKIYMLNVLWFKADGGREKYAEYLAAVSEISGPLGAKILDYYQTESEVIGIEGMGAFDPDLFFMVEWPSQSAFEAALNHPGMQKFSDIRSQSIEKSLLIRCSSATLPTPKELLHPSAHHL